MIIDGRSIPARTQLAADLCIVGAGAAGITLALALADADLSIMVLESGGLTPEPDTQDMARGRNVGLDYVPLESARLRCLGGSTMHWGGWCRPFEPIDFERRPWVPHSGWPIDFSAVEPYYPRAQELCQLGAFDYDPAAWDLPKGALLPLPADRLHSRLIQFSPPTRFGVRYRDALERAPKTTVYLHSNVTQILPAQNGATITGLRVATLTGNSFTVSAKRYVLACGGLENPRILLASNEVIASGIGNAHDLVGRFFADHIQLDTAAIFPDDESLRLDFYQPASRDVSRRSRKPGGRSANMMAYLTLDRRVQESRRTLNYSANLLETTWSDYLTAAETANVVERSVWEEVGRSLRSLWANLDDAIAATFHSGGKPAPIYKIVTTQEQAPNPDSRVRLAPERDALGMPRIQLEWRLTDLDRHSIEVAIDELTRAFGGGRIAKLHSPIDLGKHGWPTHVPISWHHCGTTRMSTHPEDGVVNADGRVHGIDNLYIAGSSIFPTNGHGNPTLTLVALTLRLADHLRSAFQVKRGAS
ncbi:MAG TPA: GMC family oxidoreductase [Steroidobacteraceae bacterium]|nr:GMC family oxidoreductase [Steroidobacteraceae bacterium]